MQPLSLIRTMTVGFGFAPNLLTRLLKDAALAGLKRVGSLPPVGTFTPP